ncbi:hypothetical protein MMC19_001429 [Ptychographa xylographoides]|nr:hypothetical protein [Ptychographa xylographoides]
MAEHKDHPEDAPTEEGSHADTSEVQRRSDNAHQTEEPDLSGPDYRAHVVRRKGDPAPRMTLYNKNDQVYLKMARGLQGPFYISKVYSDGTYCLVTESGKLYRDGAKERDLQQL